MIPTAWPDSLTVPLRIAIAGLLTGGFGMPEHLAKDVEDLVHGVHPQGGLPPFQLGHQPGPDAGEFPEFLLGHPVRLPTAAYEFADSQRTCLGHIHESETPDRELAFFDSRSGIQ